MIPELMNMNWKTTYHLYMRKRSHLNATNLMYNQTAIWKTTYLQFMKEKILHMQYHLADKSIMNWNAVIVHERNKPQFPFRIFCPLLKSITLSSLTNKHARLFFSTKEIHPTGSYLRAFYRQAAPNFAYFFIKFEVKIPAYSFVSAYLFIRELRVLEMWL